MIDSFISREALVAYFASLLFGEEILAIHCPKLKYQERNTFSFSARDPIGVFTLAISEIPCSKAEAWLRLINNSCDRLTYLTPKQLEHSGNFQLLSAGRCCGMAEMQISADIDSSETPQNFLSYLKVRGNILLPIENGHSSFKKMILQFSNKLFFADYQLIGNSTVMISIREVKTFSMEDLPITINIGSLGLTFEQLMKLRPGMEVSFAHNGFFASTLEIGGQPWALGTLRVTSEGAQFEIESLPQLLNVDVEPD